MVNKTKRLCAIALAALMSVSIFAGCGGSDSEPSASTGGDGASSVAPTENTDPLGGEGASGTINLKVWGPDNAQAILKEQCARFSEEYAQYGDIQIEVVPQGESDAGTNVLTDPSNAADVFGFACDQLDKLVTAGVLLPVMGADAEEVTAINSESSIAASTIDGTLYAYPETGDNSYCLVYDKRYVTDEDAKTLEGVLAACKAANKKFVMDAGNGYYSCLFTFTGGLTVDGLEEDGETQKFSEYDEAKVVSTLKAFSTLFNEYKDNFLNGDVSKIVDGFKSGTAAAGFDGSWNFTAAKEALGDNAGFTILPTINVDGTDTQLINMFGYKCLGVNGSTAYPNTSIELAKYLTNEQCQLERAEQINWGPSNKVVAESDVVKNDPALSAILAQSQYSVPQVSLSATFWTPMGTLGSKLVDFDNPLKSDEEYAELVKTTIANVRDE